jgi:3-hydroxymyristoyl/3-hydroxydecanoyl-(acyl carrier protein) dehydratase
LSATERFFGADHPASQGHFPGNPIIPGAVLLSEALRAIEEELGASLPRCQIRSAKFLHPVRPGDRIVIECSRNPDGEVKFTCKIGATLVLTGQVRCHAMSTAD